MKANKIEFVLVSLEDAKAFFSSDFFKHAQEVTNKHIISKYGHCFLINKVFIDEFNEMKKEDSFLNVLREDEFTNEY